MRSVFLAYLPVLLFSTLLGLGGCSTGGPIFQQEAPAGDRALVYVFRKSAMGGSASAFKIFANDKHVTNMSTGGYFAYPAAAGTLDLRAEMKANALNWGLGLALTAKPELTLDVVAGQTYFVQFEFGGMGGPKLHLVDEAAGLEEIRKCKLTKTVAE